MLALFREIQFQTCCSKKVTKSSENKKLCLCRGNYKLFIDRVNTVHVAYNTFYSAGNKDPAPEATLINCMQRFLCVVLGMSHYLSNPHCHTSEKQRFCCLYRPAGLISDWRITLQCFFSTIQILNPNNSDFVNGSYVHFIVSLLFLNGCGQILTLFPSLFLPFQ